MDYYSIYIEFQCEVDFDMHKKNQSRNNFALIFFVQKKIFFTRLHIKQIGGSSYKKKENFIEK